MPPVWEIPVIISLSGWAIRLAMIPVVMHRRAPTAALAWLTLIFFIPWAGLVLYALMGTRGLGWRRTRRHARFAAEFGRLEGVITGRSLLHEPAVDESQAPMVRLAQRMTGMLIVGGNTVEFLPVQRRFIERLVEDIDTARAHVHLLFYIFADDDSGRAIANALARAAARGVRCRLLADAVGSPGLFRGLAAELRRHGVEVEPALRVHPLRALFHRLDLRNHRKLAVIDGATAYTGSHNIIGALSGDAAVTVNDDVSVRLRGPAVAPLALVFLEDWHFQTHKLLPEAAPTALPQTAGAIAIQPVPTGPLSPVEAFRALVVAAIGSASRRVMVTTPYFVPDESTRMALALAAGKGVAVDLVVPERGNHRVVQLAGEASYDLLLASGVRIHLHRGHLLHAKTLTVDDSFALIGSGNLDIRSFSLNFELSVILYGRGVTLELRDIQEWFAAQSVLLEPAVWARRPRHRRAAAAVANLMGPLL